MKTILLIIVISLSFYSVSSGQCVIYVDYYTGAFGAGYNNDGTPTSFQDCEDAAIKMCKQSGGENYTFLYKSAKAGWWAFITGINEDGRILFTGIDGTETQSEAESAVREKYRNDGGSDPDNIKVYSWYVYSNVE